MIYLQMNVCLEKHVIDKKSCDRDLFTIVPFSNNVEKYIEKINAVNTDITEL